jgi:hypothetical protein
MAEPTSAIDLLFPSSDAAIGAYFIGFAKDLTRAASTS